MNTENLITRIKIRLKRQNIAIEKITSIDNKTIRVKTDEGFSRTYRQAGLAIQEKLPTVGWLKINA